MEKEQASKDTNDNLVLKKSLDFALRIVKLCHYLNETKREFVLSKELLISGTNIGKHVKAAVGAENRETFISEFAVARRRALETEYWLLVLFMEKFCRRLSISQLKLTGSNW